MADNILARYTIEVRDGSGNLIADLSGISSIQQISFVRNRAMSATFNIDIYKLEAISTKLGLNPLDILSVNVNEVRIKRYDKYIFAGQISNLNPIIQDKGSSITVAVTGWFDLLAQAYTGTNDAHTGEDAGAIAWDLINTFQSLTYGNIGITEGVIQTSNNRTITYNSKNIKDAIVELSSMDGGFDFEITWDKVFNVYYPYQGFDRSLDLRFEYKKNIKKLESQRDGTKMANSVLVRGAGSGSAQVTDTRTDSTSQTTYHLRQSILDIPDLTDLTSLDAAGDGDVKIYKDILDFPIVTIDGGQDPVLGAYYLGDQIFLTIPDLHFYDYLYQVKYKIDQIDVVINSDEQEEITLSLSKF